MSGLNAVAAIKDGVLYLHPGFFALCVAIALGFALLGRRK